jgi:hypothetical protein
MKNEFFKYIVANKDLLKNDSSQLSTENYKVNADDFNVKVKEQPTQPKPTTPPVSHK